MNNSDKIFIIGTFLCMICLCITLFLWHNNRTVQNETKIDTVSVRDTLWRDTTIKETQFIPKYIIKTKRDTLFTEKGDSLFTESKMYEKSFVSDKDTADAKIYVSGIKTSLDSVEMRFKSHTEVITNTITVTKEIEKKKKLFHIQPQATFGYDPLNKNWGFVVGIGIGVNI